MSEDSSTPGNWQDSPVAAPPGLEASGCPDRVEIVSPVEDFHFDVGWYEFATAEHFWFRWRMAALLQMLRSNGIALGEPLKALEVGCGTGTLRSQVEAATAWSVDGTDLDLDALSRMEPGRGKILYYNIFDENSEFVDRYDVLILFDVIEHIRDTRSFLRSALRHLRPGGYLLVNVPALQVLHSSYDELVGHERRYDKRMLTAEIAGLPLTVRDMRYWGFSMIPVLLLRKLTLGLMARQPGARRVERGFNPPHPLVHAALCAVMRAETALTQSPPAGTSLMMIGRYEPSTTDPDVS